MEWISILLTLIVSFLIVVMGLTVLYLSYVHSQYDHIPGPPRECFFSGNYNQMARLTKEGKTPCEVFLNWAKEYGQTYVMWNYHLPLVVTVSQRAIKDLCIDGTQPLSKNFLRLFQYVFGERFFGNGFATSEDEHLVRKRKVPYNPSFSMSSVKEMIGKINIILDNMVAYIEPKADGKNPLDLCLLLTRATNDIMTSGLFGKDTERFDSGNSPVIFGLRDASMGVDLQMKESVMEKICFWRNRVEKDIARRGIRIFRQATGQWMKDRISDVKNAESVPRNLLTAIAKAALAFGLSFEEAIDDITTLYAAGQDTTAYTASLAMLELGQHQEIVKQIQDEIDEVLGYQSHISYEDLSRLDLVNCVMKETLRKFPTFPYHFRDITTNNYQIDGYFIPKGTMVLINIFVAHNLPENFDDPHIFKPDRFKDNFSFSPYVYLPFLLGPRNCIAQTLAKVTVKLMITKLLQKFDFELHPSQPLGFDELSNLTPKKGLLVTMIKRQ